MKLEITKEAANWYKEELDLEEVTWIRFFVRYGGVGGRIPGFSLGISTNAPHKIYGSTEVDGITFFIEETDAWYFENSGLRISFDKKLQEPNFKYV